MKENKFSPAKQLYSFKYAFNGIKTLIKNEHNSRIHLVAAIITILAGLLFKVSLMEWIVLAIVIGQVFICEIFNSCVEYICDLVSTDDNGLIKKSKDLAAAAVLIAAIIALIVGLIIFIPKIWELIFPR